MRQNFGPDQGDGKPDWSKPGVIQYIELDRLLPDPANPRKTVSRSAMEELVADLKERGIKDPFKIRPAENPDNAYVVGGHRRLKACELAQDHTRVPCIINTEDLSESEIRRELLHDNFHRETLPPIDRAQAYREIMDAEKIGASEFAKSMRISEKEVEQTVELLKLPEAVQKHVNRGAIPESSAYWITKLRDPTEQMDAATRVLSGELRGRQVQEIVLRRGAVASSGKAVNGTPQKHFKRLIHSGDGVDILVTAKRELSDDEIASALQRGVSTLSMPLHQD